VRRTLGPFVTTGVALLGATVVVANPVLTPPNDVRIPAVQLSAGADAPLSMFDRAFLDAIAPDPPDSTSPAGVLKQLLDALAADASLIGRRAVAEAFSTGAEFVGPPALTAASAPFIPAIDVSAPVDTTASPVTPLGPTTIAASVAQEVTPVINQVLSNLEEDVTYIGGQVVTAAVAAGTIVASTEPDLIAKTITALVAGDLESALHNAVKALAAPLVPPLILIDAFKTVIEKRLGELGDVLGLPTPAIAAEAPAPSVSEPAPADSADSADSSVDPAPAGAAQRPATTHRAVTEPQPRPAGVVPARPGSRNGATDLTDGNKVVPHTRAGGKRAVGQVADRVTEFPGRVTEIKDRVRASVEGFGDAVRKIVGHRHSARPGPSAGRGDSDAG